LDSFRHGNPVDFGYEQVELLAAFCSVLELPVAFTEARRAQWMLISCLAAFVVFVALAAGDPQNDPDDNEGRSKILSAVQAPVRQLEEYQKWPMLTPGPVDVSERTFFACNVDIEAWKRLTDSQGPHWSPAIRVYANATAKAAIDEKKGTFPPGSVLVKEKLMKRKVVAITAMIRERNDYDRSHEKNNWRYFYVDTHEEMQFGRIKSCRECHKKAAETDFAVLKYSTHQGYSSFGP
jgi:hypothetical protein